MKLITYIYLTKFIIFTVRATSLPLQKCLYCLMFCLERYKIAYYLSHTGKDKKDLYYGL